MDAGPQQDIDDVLTLLKTGRWNIVIFVLCSLSGMRVPPQVLSGAYLTPSLDYTCVSPSTTSLWRSNTSNTSNGTEDPLPSNPGCEYYDQASNTVLPCTKWQYDDSVFESTITSDFDLVCERSFLRSTYTSLYMFGAVFGSSVVGYLADWKGRKVAVNIGTVGLCVFPILMTWIPSLAVIMACRFIIGFLHPILLSSFYSLALEVCEPKHRGTVGILASFPWALGTMGWGGMAYLLRDWRWLNMAVTVPHFLMLPCIWIVDESPRWLVVHGHHEKALAVLHSAARANKTTLPSDAQLRKIMIHTQQSAASNVKTTTDQPNKIKKYLRQFSLMLSTRQLRVRIFVMWLLFFVASLVFYGLSLSAVTFSADPFLYMVLGGLMEVPAYTVTAPIVDYFGRKWTTAVSYLVCGATILSLTVIPKDMNALVMTFVMVGKLAISMAYQIIYMYMLELLPTEVRLQGLGSAMLMSRVGSIIMPFITENLGEYIPWLPSAIYGCCSLVAGVATLLLPETNKKHMPDTVGAMEKTEDTLFLTETNVGAADKTDSMEAGKNGQVGCETAKEKVAQEKVELLANQDQELRPEDAKSQTS